MEIVRVEDQPVINPEQIMRPQTAKGPMGGTFGDGFMSSEEKAMLDGEAEMASLVSSISRPGTAMSNMSSFSSSRPNTAMSGFKPGSANPRPSTPFNTEMSPGANSFEANLTAKLGELCKPGPPPLPGTSSRPEVPMKSKSGQLVAERHRPVSRAPKPDKRKRPVRIKPDDGAN